jgi:hypothetical protein
LAITASVSSKPRRLTLSTMLSFAGFITSYVDGTY